MSGLAAALALLAAGVTNSHATPTRIPTPRPVAAEEEVEVVEGEADRHRRMTIPVAVEGSGPYDFVIDTGSQRTVLSTALASRLALEPGPMVTIVGVAGTEAAQTAYIEQLELGKREYFGLHAPLFASEHIGADGIIGTDSLQDQRVLIDFSRNLMEIGSQQSLGGNRGYEIVVKARAMSGQLVLTNAVIDGIKTAVIIDTGAAYSVGNRALQQKLANKRSGGIVTLHSVTGQTAEAEIGFARTLELRSYQIQNLVIAYTDSPAFTELGLDEQPALFLGMRELRLFKRVAIDFSSRRVLFDVPRS